MNIVAIGAHLTSGQSMHRYTELITRAYAEASADARVIVPPGPISRRWRWRGLKWVAYVEKFVVFWPLLWWHVRRADLVHILDHSDAIWALGVRSPSVVVTCHDLIAVRAALGEMPEHRPGASGRLYQALVLRGLRRADRVLSVSRCTAMDVGRLTERVSPVLVNPLDQRVTDVARRRPVPSRAAPYRDGDYFLVVSTRSWRKRRVASVTAWAGLRGTATFAQHDLVVVGDPLDEQEREVIRRAGAPAGAVTQLDRLPDEDLAQVYAGAAGLLHLSRYEGFGWPIIEAQANRVPVLTTDGAIFREVAGEHARFLTDDELARGDRAFWEGVARDLARLDLEAAAAWAGRFAWSGFPQALTAAVTGGAIERPGVGDVIGARSQREPA